MTLQIEVKQTKGHKELKLYDENGKLLIYRGLKAIPGREDSTDWSPLAKAFGDAITYRLATTLNTQPTTNLPASEK